MTLQLRYSWEMYNLPALLARQAFYTVPEAKPLPTFTNVQQGLSEPYSHFVDRLAQALQTQEDLDEENKQQMLKLLAFENANSKTKSLLTTSPQGAEVGEMLELAHRADQSDQGRVVAQAVAEAIKPTTNMIAAAMQKVGSKNSSKAADICYRCGAKGHYRKACH
ncbi:hypothetical protein TURU_097060 [Turdus rufiventris]|nr:hypothetical protein TURU_097060 [Turdus rufiventris]